LLPPVVGVKRARAEDIVKVGKSKKKIKAKKTKAKSKGRATRRR